MKVIKTYKMFLESLTQNDEVENNQEQIYSGEYPNNKILEPIELESEVEVTEPIELENSI